MSLITQLRQHAAKQVATWRQKAAASILGPALYTASCEFQGLSSREWFRLSEEERNKWSQRALAVLKVVAEQERYTAQQAKDQAALDKLVSECYPQVSHERRSPDGDGLGMTGPNTAVDSASARASYTAGAAKSSGVTTAAQAERNSPTAGAGSEPAASLSLIRTRRGPEDIEDVETWQERMVRIAREPDARD